MSQISTVNRDNDKEEMFKEYFYTGNLKGVKKFLKLGSDTLKCAFTSTFLTAAPVALALSYKLNDSSQIGALTLGATCLIAEIGFAEFKYGLLTKAKNKIFS